MYETLTFGIFAFVSMFAMVEPLGTMPIYISMTAHLSPTAQRNVARKACLFALCTLIGFALTGQALFLFFGISIHSLKVVGGIIIFRVGYDMLQAKLSPTTHDDVQDDHSDDVAITPLGIPMLSGPGAIANAIVLMNAADSFGKKVALFTAITGVLALTLVLLLGARRVARFLGESGNKVLLRLMGLLTMVIGVEFFFGGLKPIVQDMIKVT